ncbi:MAG: hypothetical protein KDK38_12315, partial [Leptospiraceae bacterium]|nr:hypothetical protein [Leptospiraceae bacterium]
MDKNKHLISEVRSAKEAMEHDRYTAAFNILRKVETQTSNWHLRAKILELMIKCQLAVGNSEAAEELLKDRVALPGAAGRVDYLAARFYHNMGNYEKAHHYYLRALVLKSTNVQFAIQFSIFLREIKQYSRALGVLTRCLIECKKGNFNRNSLQVMPLYMEIAHIQFSKHNYYRSMILFEHASTLNSTFVYYDQLAECYLIFKRYADAKRAIEMHIDQWGDNDAEAQFTYGKCLSV